MSAFSSAFQVNLRNFCCNLTLRQIGDVFEGAGFEAGPEPAPPTGSVRRNRVLSFWNGIGWSSPADVRKVLKLMEMVLSSTVIPDTQKDELRALCGVEGLRLDGNKVAPRSGKASGIKNLIFASNGYKPEIVLKDATTNDIQIVKNADSCLVYDRDIDPDAGLLWSELKTWWLETKSPTKDPKRAGAELYKRLEESLGTNGPEKLLLKQYITTVRPLLGDQLLPAIIPQVYLHYDPYTFRQRGEKGPLERQRMDFLLLLRGNQKVVLEIDGKQHYSNGDTSSPTLYAKMMAEDRRLKLTGYEVYRFGGQEFVNETSAATMLDDFFKKLLACCGYQPK